MKKSRQECVLHLNDLYELPTYLQSTELTDKLESHWFSEVKHHPNNPSLIRATLRTLGWKPFLYGFLILLQVRQKSITIHYIYLRIVFPGNNTDYSTIITNISDEIFWTMYFNVYMACLASCNSDHLHCYFLLSYQSSGWIFFSRLFFLHNFDFYSISIGLIYMLYKWW